MSFMDNYFGVATKRKASDELPEQSSAKKQKTPAIARDKWNSSWDKAFPWAEKLDVDGQLRAICAWCRDSKKGNSMATCGSPNLQGSTFSKHEKTREHLLSAAAHNAKQRKETVPQVHHSVLLFIVNFLIRMNLNSLLVTRQMTLFHRL